jgi:ATP-binding cassette subfamily B protein RaxB
MLGAELDMTALRRKYHNSQRGVSLEQLIAVASALYLQCRAVRCELNALGDLQVPSILHWKFNHFVVLERVSRGKYHIVDPARGSIVLSGDELSGSFTGVAVEVSTAPGFTRRKQPSPLSIWSMLRFRDGVGTALAHMMLYSILLQGFALLSPFFIQLVVDEGISRGDHGFVVALAIGFSAVALFNGLAEILRGMTLQRASALMGWDMSRRLFHHLVSLPLTWFHRRRLADALSRQESIEPIRQLIANGLIGSLLDGVLAAGVLILMMIYSPLMAFVAVGAVVLYVAIRIFTIPASMKLGMASLQAGIAEKSTRIETFRAMQSIKTMGGEFVRESLWANKYADVVRTNLAAVNLGLAISASRTLLDGLSLVLIVYLGAGAVMADEMSVGALYAFVAYRQQLSNRMVNLVDQCISWRLTELHSDRIADIVLSPREAGFSQDPAASADMRGHIRLTQVRFQYAAQESLVLKGISLRIEAGEFLAITGPSGCGKTTLIKIITGLYPQSGGDVLYDERSASNWGLRVVRQRMGVVMQDDELLTGSIIENVTFFAECPDVAWVWECLEKASIRRDVEHMPMQLETFVGDMGSTLSGGQRQRLLLARALYRRPAILVLDEATANLDVSREASIYHALKSLEITRIVVTHRPDTLRLADRLIRMDDGRIVSDVRRSQSDATGVTPAGAELRSVAPLTTPSSSAFPAQGQP